MPFADEQRAVEVVRYKSNWPSEFDTLSATVASVLGGVALAIDHIGSTAIPGMAGKDVIDVQVRVAKLRMREIESRMDRLGFRLRPEPWNRLEHIGNAEYAKLVFAPPAGGRPSNIQIREAASPTARRALLFRDYLRANAFARDTWSVFKTRVATAATHLIAYGQIKQPATEILMLAA